VAYFLPSQVDFFPHPLFSDEDGLLAIGGKMTTNQLLLAYQFGIFPWNHADDPYLWWYTHPRCVLFPECLKISKSMRPYLNGSKFQCTMDSAFHTVMQKCREVKRNNQDDTWITDDLMRVFLEIHNMGLAHSVEVWENDHLVGGLYGLALGKIFYGESMFSEKSNASKFALIKLIQFLKKNDFLFIDCQQETDHLKSLGATLLEKESFYNHLKRNIFAPSLKGSWKEKLL